MPPDVPGLTVDCKSSQLFPDSESGGGEGGHQQFCSQLDSALLLGNQRVAVKTLPQAGPASSKRQSPCQAVSSPQVPPFSGSITPSRYCDNVSLGKSSKTANWPNGYRKTISIFLDVIGRNIEVNSVRLGCWGYWGYWHKTLFLCFADLSPPVSGQTGTLDRNLRPGPGVTYPLYHTCSRQQQNKKKVTIVDTGGRDDESKV